MSWRYSRVIRSPNGFLFRFIFLRELSFWSPPMNSSFRAIRSCRQHSLLDYNFDILPLMLEAVVLLLWRRDIENNWKCCPGVEQENAGQLLIEFDFLAPNPSVIRPRARNPMFSWRRKKIWKEKNSSSTHLSIILHKRNQCSQLRNGSGFVGMAWLSVFNLASCLTLVAVCRLF